MGNVHWSSEGRGTGSYLSEDRRDAASFCRRSFDPTHDAAGGLGFRNPRDNNSTAQGRECNSERRELHNRAVGLVTKLGGCDSSPARQSLAIRKPFKRRSQNG